jgi:hypothetical protein
LLATLAEMAMLDADLSPAPELVEALLRTGSTDEAATVAARYGDLAAAKGLPWAQARAARLRGLLCAPHEMDGCFAEALALHAQTPDMYEEARTRLLYGERLRRARRRADARNPLRLALDRFQQLGAWPWVDLAAAELEVTGETVVRRDRDQRDALTPRPHHPRGGRCAIPQPQDGRVPPAPRLHKAGHHQPLAARRRDRQPTRTTVAAEPHAQRRPAA